MDLPELYSETALTSEQIASYQRNGYLLLRGVATPEEVAPYRDAITANVNQFALKYAPIEERDTYGKAFIQKGHLCWESEIAAKFVFARRFAKLAADLMGVEGVRLYHDQALYKEAGGGFTPWHQDQQYWPLDGVACVTLWMPLTDCTAEMGTMRFAEGSQELGYLGPLNISDDSEIRLQSLVEKNGYPLFYAGAMQAGDATFHNGWTLHGAPGNASTDRTREVMTIIYMDADGIITEPDSPQRQGDYDGIFFDSKPGEKAEGRMTPLLYHRSLKP